MAAPKKKNESSPEFRVSVREVVAFCFPPEDLLPGGGVEDMLAGGRAHRSRQEQQTGETERPIRHSFSLRGETVELYGRMDAFTDGPTPLVEEMKLSRHTGDAPLPEHRAQALLYAAMAALEENRPSVECCVTYLNVQGEVLRRFSETLSRDELSVQTEEWLNRWLDFALRERDHRHQRDESIWALAFPFPAYRAGQRELAAQVYTAISRKKRLFACLPTGTGKSAAVLFPALKAMGEGKTDKLLYLTARNTARQSPIQALERMKAQGLHARVSVLTAREKLCPEEMHCHPDFCPRARGHFLRQEDAVRDLLEGSAAVWTDEAILAAADRHTICPFELALYLSELADVVLMDMNYLFDPFAQAKRLFVRRRAMTALIDEAHHTLERVRESLSGTLDGPALREARTELGKCLGRKHPCYGALGRLLRHLRELDAGETETLDALPEGIVSEAMEVQEQISALIAKPDGAPLSLLFSVLRMLLPFLYAAEHQKEEYAVLLEKHGRERTLILYCLWPGTAIAAATRPMRGTVFFSATLSPLGAMKELLGGSEDDACFALPSPFPREHLQVIRQRISTRYADREKSAAQVAQAIRQAVGVRAGKYIAFFPSYVYLELVLGQLQAEGETLPTLWVQKRDMTEEQKESFFTAFTEEKGPRLGLCVLGGLFSEGIDLPGEQLIGVIVVGVGLPTPSARLRAVQRCYQAHFGDGFGYACRIPAMQKVLQAGGRVIRSESDRGFLLLLDDRYDENAYASLLPEEWKPFGENVAQAAQALWGKPL